MKKSVITNRRRGFALLLAVVLVITGMPWSMMLSKGGNVQADEAGSNLVEIVLTQEWKNQSGEKTEAPEGPVKVKLSNGEWTSEVQSISGDEDTVTVPEECANENLVIEEIDMDGWDASVRNLEFTEVKDQDKISWKEAESLEDGKEYLLSNGEDLIAVNNQGEDEARLPLASEEIKTQDIIDGTAEVPEEGIWKAQKIKGDSDEYAFSNDEKYLELFGEEEIKELRVTDERAENIVFTKVSKEENLISKVSREEDLETEYDVVFMPLQEETRIVGIDATKDGKEENIETQPVVLLEKNVEEGKTKKAGRATIINTKKDSDKEESVNKDQEGKEKDEAKDNEVKDNEVKDNEVKDNEVKDDKAKDDEVKDDEVKDDKAKDNNAIERKTEPQLKSAGVNENTIPITVTKKWVNGLPDVSKITLTLKNGTWSQEYTISGQTTVDKWTDTIRVPIEYANEKLTIKEEKLNGWESNSGEIQFEANSGKKILKEAEKIEQGHEYMIVGEDYWNQKCVFTGWGLVAWYNNIYYEECKRINCIWTAQPGGALKCSNSWYLNVQHYRYKRMSLESNTWEAYSKYSNQYGSPKWVCKIIL